MHRPSQLFIFHYLSYLLKASTMISVKWMLLLRCCAERAHFLWCCNYNQSFQRICNSKLVMHEFSLHDEFDFWNNLVAIETFQSLLSLVTYMVTVFYLLEILDDGKFTNSGNEMALLPPTLSNLSKRFKTQRLELNAEKDF